MKQNTAYLLSLLIPIAIFGVVMGVPQIILFFTQEHPICIKDIRYYQTSCLLNKIYNNYVAVYAIDVCSERYTEGNIYDNITIANEMTFGCYVNITTCGGNLTIRGMDTIDYSYNKCKDILSDNSNQVQVSIIATGFISAAISGFVLGHVSNYINRKYRESAAT